MYDLLSQSGSVSAGMRAACNAVSFDLNCEKFSMICVAVFSASLALPSLK